MRYANPSRSRTWSLIPSSDRRSPASSLGRIDGADRHADHRQYDVHAEGQEGDRDGLEDAAQVEAEVEARGGVSDALSGTSLGRDDLHLPYGSAFFAVHVRHDEAHLIHTRVRVPVRAGGRRRETSPVAEIPL